MNFEELYRQNLTKYPTKQAACVKSAYERGYRMIGGELFNRLNKKIKEHIDKKGYKYIDFIVCEQNSSKKAISRIRLFTHRLAAYQKFGEKIFDKNLVVRHLDGNSSNNHPENLGIGTQKENLKDIPQKIRRIVSLTGAFKTRMFTDEEIKAIIEDVDKQEGKYLKHKMQKTAEKYKCSYGLVYEKYKNKGYLTSMPNKSYDEFIRSNT